MAIGRLHSRHFLSLESAKAERAMFHASASILSTRNTNVLARRNCSGPLEHRGCWHFRTVSMTTTRYLSCASTSAVMGCSTSMMDWGSASTRW